MTFWSSRTIDLINLFSGILWADCVGGGGREGDYWKTLAVAMNVWLCKTDTSASAASSNVPHALCEVRQNCRVHVITQPTATLHKLFVYEIFIAVASGQVSNCLDMTIYRLVALRALCDSEKDKGVHFVCVSTLLCLCLMWPLLWSERDTELQSTHGPGQAGPDPDNFSPRHVGVKCASGQDRGRESVSLAEVRSPLTPVHTIWGHPGPGAQDTRCQHRGVGAFCCGDGFASWSKQNRDRVGDTELGSHWSGTCGFGGQSISEKNLLTVCLPRYFDILNIKL